MPRITSRPNLIRKLERIQRDLATCEPAIDRLANLERRYSASTAHSRVMGNYLNVKAFNQTLIDVLKEQEE